MDRKRTGWWAATLVLGAGVVVTGIARASGEEGGSDAYEAGEVVGSILGGLLIPAVIAFLIVRFGKVDGYWALPGVLAVGLLINVVLVLAQEGERLSACEGAPALQAASLVPAGSSYRARPLPAAQAAQVDAAFELEGTVTDTTQVVDTRDSARYVVATATSEGEEVRPEDVFAGFVEAAGSARTTRLGGADARYAQAGGFTRVIAVSGCSAITLIGAGEEPTLALAAELRP